MNTSETLREAGVEFTVETVISNQFYGVQYNFKGIANARKATRATGHAFHNTLGIRGKYHFTLY